MDDKSIKIGMAEDHQLFRKGLITMLSSEEEFDIIFDVSNGSELMEALTHNQIDVLLLDIEMPIIDGLVALQSIEANYPMINVIMISSHYNNQMIYDSISKGAKGFLPKQAELQTVIDAINVVSMNQYFFDEKVSPQLVSSLNRSKAIYPKYDDVSLSKRELEILPLICSGKTNLEMADKLFISKRTVENHRKSIFEKTDSKNSQELLIYSLKTGLFKISS